MSDQRREKYNRFKSVLYPPYDNHPSGAFPIFTVETPFNLSDYVAESANPNVEMFDHLIRSKPYELFLDLGCGRREKTFDNCLYLEVYPSISADIIVDSSCRYPIRDGTLAGIGCFAVLEHTRKPWIVVQEIYRMLKRGGQVVIDWPFLQPVHGYPSHFFNATREGLTSIFQDQGLKIEQAFTGRHQTVAYTVQWILGALNHNLPAEIRPDFYQMSVGELLSLSPQDERWWRFIETLSPEAQSELACGNMLVATKTG